MKTLVLWMILLFSPFAYAQTDIKLSWIDPIERQDLTPLTYAEIGGYKVHYKTTINGAYNIIFPVGKVNTHTMVNVADGTYYFVMTTLDSEGRESEYSKEVIVIVDSTIPTNQLIPKHPTTYTITVNL